MWQKPNEAKTQRGTSLTRQKLNVAAKTHCGKNPMWQKPNEAKTQCGTNLSGKNLTWQKPNVAKTPWFTISDLGLQTYQ